MRVLLSVIYWMVAMGIVFVAGYVLPGDCWTERTRSGFNQCMNEGRAIYVVGFAVVSILYVLIWRVARGR